MTPPGLQTLGGSFSFVGFSSMYIAWHPRGSLGGVLEKVYLFCHLGDANSRRCQNERYRNPPPPPPPREAFICMEKDHTHFPLKACRGNCSSWGMRIGETSIPGEGAGRRIRLKVISAGEAGSPVKASSPNLGSQWCLRWRPNQNTREDPILHSTPGTDRHEIKIKVGTRGQLP